MRTEVAAVLARQAKDKGRSAVTIEVSEPELKQIVFDPAATYLLTTASQRILGEYMAGRLNHAANLRRAIGDMQNQLAVTEAEAMLGRWLMHNRESLLATFRRAAGEGPLLDVPGRAQNLITELAQRLLGPAQPKRKAR